MCFAAERTWMPAPYDKILRAYSDVVLLKVGGQKAAYRATDRTHGRVVVKIGRYPSANALERIRREVEVLRGVASHYYPRNIDFRTESPDLFVIVEEYVESRPLSGLLGDFAHPKDALRFLRHLVQALDVIWQKRIVHRDIKPDNILILADMSPKIIDLGIARLLDEESLTKTVNARGPCTPAYASPEQLKNRKAQIDQRADQFSLGIVLVQLLLKGQHPFDPNVVGSGDSIPANILTTNWAQSRLISLKHPDSIRSLATKLLGPEPHNRYRNCDAILKAIAQCEGDLS
jgi:serine/threonine-protein kinase